MGKEYIKVPLDLRFNPYVEIKPKITSQMKAECIGDFSWKEDAPYYNEDGAYIEHTAIHTVPWDLCKEIYKAMALIATKEINNDK